MKVTFRQGIARYQTDVGAVPTFLQKSGTPGFIDLIVSPDPTIIVFAHKNANYVFEEPKTLRQAWGPFTGGITQYLYWDVNTLTGALTRGITSLPPIHAGVAPPAPAVGQHWFDALNTVMKVWEAPGRWVEKIRVFAAIYQSSAVIKPYPLGSQVGITGSFDAGNIVLDTFFKPLRQSDGSFVTSTTQMSVANIATSGKLRFETEVTYLIAGEYIPKYTVVELRPGRKIVPSLSTNVKSRPFGVVVEDLYTGESGMVITGGLIRNQQWSWNTTDIGKPVFMGPNGELTLTMPYTGLFQKMGQIYDTDSIHVRMHPLILLDDPEGGTTIPDPVDPLAPVAGFTVVPFDTTVEAPHTFQFQDLSTYGPTFWEWDFTNDGTVDSVVQNPTWTYSTPGTYTVRLRAGNGYGVDDEIKTNYITVTAPPSSGTFTNLEINLGGPMQVNRLSLFTVMVTVRNDGFLTATNVVRTIEVLDVAGQQAAVSGLPGGSTIVRSTNGIPRTIITLPVIPSMSAGSPVTQAFTVQAPGVSNQSIRFNASVASPEVDVETGDNTVSLYVRVV